MPASAYDRKANALRLHSAQVIRDSKALREYSNRMLEEQRELLAQVTKTGHGK